MPRVMVFPFMLKDRPGPYRDVLEQAGLDVVYPTDGAAALQSPMALANELRGVDAALAGMEPFTAEVLAGSQLRVIARMGVGYDAIDIPAATARRIAVAITPGTNHESVAEQTMALILGVMRAFGFAKGTQFISFARLAVACPRNKRESGLCRPQSGCYLSANAA